MWSGRGDGVVVKRVVWCSPPTPAGPSALKLAWQAASTLGVLCVMLSGVKWGCVVAVYLSLGWGRSSGDFFSKSHDVFKKWKMAGFFELVSGRCSLKKWTGTPDFRMIRGGPL